jgi:hypothetical protein
VCNCFAFVVDVLLVLLNTHICCVHTNMIPASTILLSLPEMNSFSRMLATSLSDHPPFPYRTGTRCPRAPILSKKQSRTPCKCSQRSQCMLQSLMAKEPNPHHTSMNRPTNKPSDSVYPERRELLAEIGLAGTSGLFVGVDKVRPLV